MKPHTVEIPPVRYSVSQRGYDPEVGRRLQIMVDGVEQRSVVAYDTEAGNVLRHKLSEDGRPMLNAKRDTVMRETVRGSVTVEWKDESCF